MIASLILFSYVERLELKKQLNCSDFSWYAQFFKNRAVCLLGKTIENLHYCIEKMRSKNYKPCGKDYTVNINDLPSVPINQLFFKPVNFSWGKHCSFVCFSIC